MATNPFDISGRLALITGSTRGLGYALATGLAEAGARVVVHGRDPVAVTDAARTIGELTGNLPVTSTFDVTDADAAARGIAAVIADHGIPDILVNNAGIQRRAPFNDFDSADWDAIVTTNLSSVFYVSQPVTRAMAERGSGKVVNIGSVQSMLARQTIAPYSATKGAVAMLSKGMAGDLARFNIQVNTISPGYLATEMNRALVDDEEFNSWLINRTPARRWGKFEEIVGTLIYLSSDASTFVSGQNIFVDGGMTSVV